MTAGRGRGRSRPGADPRSLLASLKFGFVGLVAVSSSLMSLAADAPLSVVAGAGVVGFVVGLVVVWIAFPGVSDRDR